MQRVEPFEHGDRDADPGAPDPVRRRLPERPQIAALGADPSDERAAIVGDAGIVDTDERGMAKWRAVSRLAHETRRDFGILRKILRVRILSAHVTAQQLVVRGIDRGDAARADQLDQLVLVRDPSWPTRDAGHALRPALVARSAHLIAGHRTIITEPCAN